MKYPVRFPTKEFQVWYMSDEGLIFEEFDGLIEAISHLQMGTANPPRFLTKTAKFSVTESK